MSTIQYLPWAVGGGANVYDPASYAALAARPAGVQAGLADGQAANTAWRQASMMAAALANFISAELGVDVLDNGDLNALVALLTSAVGAGATSVPSRLIVSSADFSPAVTDYQMGFNRTSGVATQNVTFLASPTGKEYVAQDIAANFNAFPVTVLPPAGGSIAGRASYVMDQDRQTARFHHYGTNIWGVES